MKNNPIIPIGCLLLLFVVAPIIQQPKTKLDNNFKEGVINSEFVVDVQDINISKSSGLTTCTMFISNISKQLVGPCITTNNNKLVVGHKYLVTRAVIKNSNISINNAKDLGSGVKWQVVETYVKARTPLMKISDGVNEKVVGNDKGLIVGSYVDVN